MSKAEECHRHAANCYTLAGLATTPAERAHWLLMGQYWTRRAHKLSVERSRHPEIQKQSAKGMMNLT
jgi:hypothetical protein